MTRKQSVLSLFATAFVALGQTASGQSTVPPSRLGDWDPAVISARIPSAKFVLSGTELYGPYSGRSVEMREGLIGGTVTPRLYVWTGGQRYVVKGRKSNSRMRLSSTSFGLRYQLREPNENGDYGSTIQLEFLQATDAQVVVAQSRAVYGGTKGESASISFDHARGLRSRFGLTEEHNSSDGQALALSIGGAKDFGNWRDITFRGQADLVLQTWRSSADGSRKSLEAKSIFNFGAGYTINKWASLEGDLTVMPFGVPYYAGRLSSLGSFLFYEPAGVAGELRKRPVGYAGLYLVLKWGR